METYSPEGRYAHTTKLGIFAHFALYSARQTPIPVFLLVAAL
jgi:hypothetical protein